MEYNIANQKGVHH